MAEKNKRTTCSGLEWDSMLGLLNRLKKDKRYKDYMLIGIGSYFGLRANDLLNLKWSDVLNKDEITVVEKKTGKNRLITISPNAKEIIEFVSNDLMRGDRLNSDAFVFANSKGGKLSIQYINRRLHETFKTYNIKVQNGSTHTLRKTFGKRVWEMDGKSERSLIYLSEIFSHSSIAITKRYIGITQKDIENIYLNL